MIRLHLVQLATLQQYHREDGVLIYGIDGSPDFKSMLKLG